MVAPRSFLALLLPLLGACLGLDTFHKDAGGGHDLDSGDTAFDSGQPLDSAVDGNSAPIADAGDDLVGSTARFITLDGTGSSDPDLDALTYSWELTTAPSGSAASLADPDQTSSGFVPDIEGRYVASLTVSDGGLHDTDDVEITVTSENGAPVANAGPDQTVATGTFVTLSGTGSSDPNGDTLLYVWTMTSRPGGSAALLSGSSSPSPTFTADLVGNYEVSLTVSDGTSYSSPDTLRVRAEDGSSTGGGSTACGCQGAPDAIGMTTLLGGLFALPAALRRRRDPALSSTKK
ncbi:MAG: hypothetical protein EXR69_09280 [Myxococcales bacterium]|nr:hypothetical protein [Myxococcales bacterium]